jgi:hypothetical protein
MRAAVLNYDDSAAGQETRASVYHDTVTRNILSDKSNVNRYIHSPGFHGYSDPSRQKGTIEDEQRTSVAKHHITDPDSHIELDYSTFRRTNDVYQVQIQWQTRPPNSFKSAS